MKTLDQIPLTQDQQDALSDLRLRLSAVRHQITDIVFEINLKFGTNFSTLVVDRESWDSGLYSVLPLRDEIVREGVPV